MLAVQLSLVFFWQHFTAIVDPMLLLLSKMGTTILLLNIDYGF
jgi:hypothetical protein